MKRAFDDVLSLLVCSFIILCSYFCFSNILNTARIEQNGTNTYLSSSVIEIEKTITYSETVNDKETNTIVPVSEVENVFQQEENYSNDEASYSNYYEDYSSKEEIVGNRIRIGGILDSPLMTDSTGEHFYLNHNIYGDYDGLGVPYTDFRTDFTTRKTIIYAHSSTMGNGPFQALQNYHNNKWFYDNNRYITIDYNGNHYTYEIFSVYVSVAENDRSEGLEYFYNMNYSDRSWGERIQWYKDNSEYDTGVSVNSSDKILILQTCSMDPNYYEKYYRYNLLVMGKLI